MKLRDLASLAGFALFVAVPASAEMAIPSASDDIEKYRDAGEWTIYQNNTRGSCLAVRRDDTGHAVQMGFTADGDYGYVGVFIKGAEVSEEIKDVAILVNENLYIGEAHPAAHLEDGYQGGYVLANNKDFRIDLEKTKELVAFPDAPYSLRVDMEDASKAIYEVRKCTSEISE